VKELAQRLDEARRDACEIEQLTAHVKLTEADGYTIQDALLVLETARGARQIGWKLGLTSVAKQEQVGVHTPIHGFLLDRMLHPASEPLQLAGLIHPRGEPEFAFLLRADLEGDVSPVDVLAATETILPAVEILDSRYRDFRFTLPDVLADNTSAGLVVLGKEGLPPAGLDLPTEQVVFSVNGNVHATATGAAVLGDPAAAVAWLASRRPLRAGELILSGALTDAVPLEPGMKLTVQYAHLGTLQVVVAR
jgi:2-oxo-3-hexenedioate decarboxylase